MAVYIPTLIYGITLTMVMLSRHKKPSQLYLTLVYSFVSFCIITFLFDSFPYILFKYQGLSFFGPTSSLIFSAALYWACLKLNFFSLKDSLIKISLIMLGLIILTGFFMPISNMNSIRILLIGLCVFLIRDIWRKDSALQDDFLQTKQKLETATEEKEALTDYVKDMAHKLKSPFNMIENLIVEVMSITKKGAAQLFRAFDIAHSTRSQMNNLIMAGGIDSQQTNLDRQPADVTSLIKDSLPEWRALCPNHKLTLTDTLGPTNLIIDRNALKDALTNLIDNARKYSPMGSHISIALKKDRRSVLISVTDEGRGIPFEARNKIFDRNYQIKDTESGQVGSAGLGLSLVRWITEQHGGEVRVQSRLGQGSTFTILLPIQIDAGQPDDRKNKRVVKQTLRP